MGYNIMLGPSSKLVVTTGRGVPAESYGEDPFLNGKFAAADERGDTRAALWSLRNIMLQQRWSGAPGSTPCWCRSAACVNFTHTTSACPRHEGPTTGIMVAYNSVNGLHNAQNKHTMTDILKNSWGLKGLSLPTGTMAVLAIRP